MNPNDKKNTPEAIDAETAGKNIQDFLASSNGDAVGEVTGEEASQIVGGHMLAQRAGQNCVAARKKE